VRGGCCTVIIDLRAGVSVMSLIGIALVAI
jgi:hypothetical protein